MTDEGSEVQPVVTVLARMMSAGIAESRAHEHIERGMVRVAGEPVTDPRTPLAWPARWVVAAT